MCPLWKQQRVGALTASIIHKAARYRKNNPDNYILKEIMGESTFLGNSATSYGQKYEALARKLYESQMRKMHCSFKVKCSGLIIQSKNCPLIRATPDGITSCRCCGTGILEIKCPYKHKFRDMTGENIARDGSYHLKIGENNNIKLKEESQWYSQIQIQLGVSNYSWCDLVIFTKAVPHITIERIEFNKERFDCEVQRSLIFHEKYVMPKLQG